MIIKINQATVDMIDYMIQNKLSSSLGSLFEKIVFYVFEYEKLPYFTTGQKCPIDGVLLYKYGVEVKFSSVNKIIVPRTKDRASHRKVKVDFVKEKNLIPLLIGINTNDNNEIEMRYLNKFVTTIFELMTPLSEFTIKEHFWLKSFDHNWKRKINGRKENKIDIYYPKVINDRKFMKRIEAATKSIYDKKHQLIGEINEQ